MGLTCTPENFRVELARSRISQSDLALVIGMNRQELSMFLSGYRISQDWALHNIGLGLNALLGEPRFDLDPAYPNLRPADREPPRRKKRRKQPVADIDPTARSLPWERPNSGDPLDPLIAPPRKTSKTGRRRLGKF